MNAADLLLKCLEEQGVSVIFGLPGEENADLMMALLNSSIQFVTCRHEQTAAFMADMYGRLTGRPGVCLSTLGPGSTNLITGVANANMDNVPLIAIIGQVSTSRLHKESHQNIDAVSMYKPVTKWATTIRSADVIPEVIYKAFILAGKERPGSILIELPEDVAGSNTTQCPIPNTKVGRLYGNAIEFLDSTVTLIKKAQAPLLLIGLGCCQGVCDKDLNAFMSSTQIYGTTTFMGKGAISDHSPYSLFTVGLGMRDIALEAFEKADLVICIGYRLVEWLPGYWNIGIKKKIIHIDVAPPEVDANYLPEIELIGNIQCILQQLNMKVRDYTSKENSFFASIRTKILEDLALETTSDSFPVKPQRNLYDLRSVMHDRDILISDVGAHKMWVARQYPAYHSKTCFIYNGFSSMGGALPGSIVAKWLHPEKTVVALCGDGAFIMSITALVTAVQYRTPIIVIIWEDDSYGLIKWEQEMVFHKSAYVALFNPDLAKVAKAFGCYAKRITAPGEFIPAFNEAKQNTDAPTVIIVPIDYSENMKLTQRLGKMVPN